MVCCDCRMWIDRFGRFTSMHRNGKTSGKRRETTRSLPVSRGRRHYTSRSVIIRYVPSDDACKILSRLSSRLLLTWPVESSPIASLLKRVTVVFLYTYPTLLVKTVPLLDKLCSHGNVRAVVTLRYHLGDEIVEREDTEHEFQLYARMKSRNES